MIKTKKAPKPCDVLQWFLIQLNEYPLQDKRRSKEHTCEIIPLISSSKVWFMDIDDLKIIGLLNTIFVPAIAGWLNMLFQSINHRKACSIPQEAQGGEHFLSALAFFFQ